MIAAAALAAAVALMGRARVLRPRLRRLLPDTREEHVRPSRRPLVMRLAAALLGVAIAMWLGGLPGVLIGALATGAALGVISRAEPRAARRRREQLRNQQAQAAELLGACLSSGSTIEDAVAAVAAAVPEPMSYELRYAHRALVLGARDPWARLRPAPIAHALQRSRDSGAPLAEVLGWIAVESRRDARAAAERAARAAGVSAVAPLAACFLPSFLLIAVVPVVAVLAQGIWH